MFKIDNYKEFAHEITLENVSAVEVLENLNGGFVVKIKITNEQELQDESLLDNLILDNDIEAYAIEIAETASDIMLVATERTKKERIEMAESLEQTIKNLVESIKNEILSLS